MTININNPSDITAALGRGGWTPGRSLYERAVELIEMADDRVKKIPDLRAPQSAEEAKRWVCDNEWAEAQASAALSEHHLVAKAERLHAAAAGSSSRDYAKSCSALIAIKRAVWLEAWTKALIKDWKLHS